ncbi:tetratricopeptide repeat protein [Candidatus Dependentiae bacterium]|nr:tetratricopeptide repeat protein [Candidatus Dependentiae bacterium]
MKRLIVLLMIMSFCTVSIFADQSSDLFDKALAKFEMKKYKDTYKLTKIFLAKYQDSESRDDVLFLQGKTLYFLWDRENALKKKEHEYNIQDAIDSFETLYKEFPDSPHAPYSMLWIGTCHYSDRKLNKAIETYEILIKKYTSHKETKNALYKIGKCYEKKNDFKSALKSYELVVSNFSDSKIAKQAEYDIKRIKKIQEINRREGK